jgi:beta-glucanase (GH16 family)
MNRTVAVTIAILFALLTASPSPPASPSWVLTWSDEFDGAAGLGPDTTKWGFDIGVGQNGWGNNELEYYTNRTQNASTDGTGNLVIKAIKETFTGTGGITRDYTSARLLTSGKFTQRFGRFEARIKLPVGQGIWPAFWMLGDDIATAGWPTCGEIDIMENRGREPSINYGSLHGPGYSGGNPLSSSYTLPGAERFTDDFHIFAIEWEPSAIRFYVDGNLYQTRTPSDVPAGQRWVFDHPFFILLNLAIGGNFGGNPDSTTTWPQMMLVDYVRVYRDASVHVPTISMVSISKKDLIVEGRDFDAGAKIVLNGEQQKTRGDESDLGTLVGKKVAKKIGRGESVILQVKNSDGTLSPEFNFTRP